MMETGMARVEMAMDMGTSAPYTSTSPGKNASRCVVSNAKSSVGYSSDPSITKLNSSISSKARRSESAEYLATSSWTEFSEAGLMLMSGMKEIGATIPKGA